MGVFLCVLILGATGSSAQECDWQTSGDNVWFDSDQCGGVGIGTDTPSDDSQFDINGKFLFRTGGGLAAIWITPEAANFRFSDRTPGACYWEYTNEMRIKSLTAGKQIMRMQTDGDVKIGEGWAAEGYRLDVAGSVQIKDPGGEPEEVADLEVEGTTSTAVLVITGGADLAEPFDITGDNVTPGLVASIDPTRPGKLKVSEMPYDRTVIGVVSGAGGINTGALLGASFKNDGASYPVALTGRVYVEADATNTPIQPGDLLTTSGTAGHVMKVEDHDRAIGAILGKAMTGLDEGTGLVLMVVALQ